MNKAERTRLAAELPKRYNPAAVEDKWYAAWEEAGVFHSTPTSERKPFTVVIPPPNVTGILHMGHALNNTLQDILVRAARMRGRETLWMPGTDHAGIATQNVVERALQEEGKHREDLGREKFVERVWQWKEEYGSTIIRQLKKLGASCDWQRERFTMDEGLSRAVREVFLRLYHDGLVYRGRRLINWCVRCRTALADDEIEHEEQPGHLWHIRYPVKGKRKHLVVATTRPETMLGDTAVAVHPDDERYRGLVGATVTLPVVEREIPVVADTFVDPKFGTGVVKVTPAHDPNDYECGLRHDLEQVTVIGEDGKMSPAAGKYAGLDRFRCRERLVEELDELKLLERVDDHVHAVGHCYRCHAIVEPYLSEQWFVRMQPLAEKAMAASQSGLVKFHPQRWQRVYLSWLEDVRDWCISRQIWWGHRIPVWYHKQTGEVIVPRPGEPDPDQSGKYEPGVLERDPDVLDTWFSSALWPFSTIGWPEQTPELEYYYPTDVLVTDRGIIYFWVARMVMMGLRFMGKVPFSHVYIHGTILDEHGAKMSKSTGNGIDPLVMIRGGSQERFGKEFTCEGYGADAVRYTLAALTTEGQDIKLSPTRFEMGRNFINKVWNVSRFVLMNLAPLDGLDAGVEPERLEFEDRWILSRLAGVIIDVTRAIDAFKYSDYAHSIYDFIWRDFCDWYVEMVKPRLSAGGEDSRVAGTVLAWVLDQILRLLHPVAPFFTEEVWSQLGRLAPRRGLEAPAPPAAPLLISADWARAREEHIQQQVEEEMARIQDVIRAVRNIRAKFNLAPGSKVDVTVRTDDADYCSSFTDRLDLVRSQAGVASIEMGTDLEKPAQAAAEMLDGAQIYVPLAGLMDVDKERARAVKKLADKEKALSDSKRKLQNQQFLQKAPPQIVEREERRKQELTRQITQIQELLQSLGMP